MRHLALACCVALALAENVDAQTRRRLASRAAFARLDTMALIDSSELRPLDPRQRFDSLMLGMMAHLNGSYASAAGIPPAAIRRWEGYSTQAHPVAGVLVDRPEVDELLAVLASRKGEVRIDSAEIERRVNHVAEFVVGHEFAHLVQYALLPRALVEDMNATRVIECAADIIGGALHNRYLAARVVSDSARLGALAAVIDFGWQIGAGNWLDATSHPVPEHRMQCIRLGQATEVAELGRLNDWSLEEARRITAVSVVDRDRTPSVDRSGAPAAPSADADSAMTAFLAGLMKLAENGSEALLTLRGAPLLDASTFIMIRALPEPWRCTLAIRAESVDAGCAMQGFNGDREYTRLAAAVGELIAGTGWTRAKPVELAARHGGRRETFILTSGRRTRASIEMAVDGADTGARVNQMAPQSRVTIVVRAHTSQ